MSTVPSLAQRPAWKSLTTHAAAMQSVQLRQLFHDDPARGTRLTVDAEGIFLDYSKNRVTDETLQLLIQLAEQSGLKDHIEAMFTGQKINSTEGRAVLHVALRAPKSESILVDGEDVVSPQSTKSGQDVRLRRPHPLWRVEGPHRQAYSQRRQHRHRRLRSRPRHGL